MPWDIVIFVGIRILGYLVCFLVVVVGWLRIEQLCRGHRATVRRARIGLAIVAVGAVGLPLLQFLMSLHMAQFLIRTQWSDAVLASVVKCLHLATMVANWFVLATGLAFLIAAITADRQPPSAQVGPQ